MKRKNYKRIMMIFLPILIVAIVAIVFVINNNLSKDNKFSILEKRWIEKNQSEVIDVSILNDIPLLAEDGEGVFFDFLEYFTKQTKIKFNLLPYSSESSAKTSDYCFESNNKDKLNDNELLFLNDSYVIISKDNTSLKNINEMSDTTIGILENDIKKIKDYFGKENEIIFNNYTNISSLVKAINNNDILYAIIPHNLYINEIFKNNYYVVYNLQEINTNYILNEKGNNKILNSIIKKYYNIWKEKKLGKSYNQKLLNSFFEQKNISDLSRADFLSKNYVYGFVKNLPYESKINNEFIGFNSELLNDFSEKMNANFKIKEYRNVEDLSKALNNGEVDIAFNYYNFTNLDKNGFDYTFTIYPEKAVVLTNIKNIDVSVSSFNSLKSYDIYMINDKISTYMKNKYDLDIKTFDSFDSLINNLDENSVVVMDYYLYDYYKKNKLDKFKVIFENNIDLDFNYIINNSTKNKSFISLFKYYVSTNNSSIFQSKAYLKLNSDRKILDLKYIYVLIGLFIIVTIISIYFKKEKSISNLKRSEKVRYVDHLTSLKNRNYLNQNYKKWQDNKIYPQAVIIIELNKIGHINDVYGHEEGDNVIRKAANILINNQLEQSDIVRTNGDEFLVYLVGYEENKVITYMRKLYKEFKNLPYNFGVNLGYSMILDEIKTIDDAINEAVLEIKTSKEINNTED